MQGVVCRYSSQQKGEVSYKHFSGGLTFKYVLITHCSVLSSMFAVLRKESTSLEVYLVCIPNLT